MSLKNIKLSIHPIQSIKKVLMRWKWSRERSKKGYCEYDLYSISNWFMGVVPEMIEKVRANKLGIPSVLIEESRNSHNIDDSVDFYSIPEELLDEIEKEAANKWDEILSKMVFLMRESNEDTCSKKNPYEEEYNKAREEFAVKYGDFGEKLLTEEDKEYAKQTGGKKAYFLCDVPEYREIHNNYIEEEQKLWEYHETCQKEGLDLFVKWFSYLGI